MAEASARPRQGDAVNASAAAAAAALQYYYPYEPIVGTLKHSSRRVCLFAVVAEIGAAVPSDGGTDFTVTLRIADESRKEGVSATFFAKDADQLPCVKSTGDVISLRCVQIKEHKGHFYVKFDKRLSSFALYQGKISAGCSHYQASTEYHGTIKHDEKLLTQMRTWRANLPDDSLGLKGLELQLSNLKSDSTFDLVCKVLHVLQHNGKWIYYVWDGTDTPIAEFQTSSDAEEVASPLNSPPLLEGPPLPREVLCTMPCVGTVLRISSNKNFGKVPYMSTYWVRFWNVTCKQEFGIWKGDLSDSSGVRLLSHNDGSVVNRLRMFDSRNATKGHRRLMASPPFNVTDVDIDCKKGLHSTLMESITYNKGVTHKVKTLVRVVAAYPCRPSEVRLFLAGEYYILLTLEDPTARIHAFVSTDELVKFFGGGPLTEEVVLKKMNKLLGVPRTEDSEEVAPLTWSPPWVWCCLKSYYTDENDPWDSRRYQIYGTRIRD